MTKRLRILHCMRAPVGGLFRHVLDLAGEQAARGHQVGILADANTSDALTRSRFDQAAPSMELGIELISMGRKPGLADIGATRAVGRHARRLSLDILHGHGAKGGAYARLAGRKLRRSDGRPVATFYTPHGGTLNFPPASLEGRIYHRLEQALAGMTSGIVFESDFARRIFADRIGAISTPQRVVPNGLSPADFAPHQPAPGAAQFVFIGELRDLKGVEILLRALKRLSERGPASAVIVGSGPDEGRFRALATELDLDGYVRFAGAMPAKDAFSLGHVLVVPSLKESFPYIVLEGAAAGIPLIATSVGGIPEMVAGTRTALIEPGDVSALAEAMRRSVSERDMIQHETAELLETVKSKFTVARMTSSILEFYSEVCASS